MWEHMSDLASGIVVVGATVLLIGYIVGQWRTGAAKNNLEALNIAQAEIELLKSALDRKESAISENSKEIAHLRGELAQLRSENAELRKLVMGERVPDALFKALVKVTSDEGEKMRELSHLQHTDLMAALSEQHRDIIAHLERGEEA